jgi:hypothetical protein
MGRHYQSDYYLKLMIFILINYYFLITNKENYVFIVFNCSILITNFTIFVIFVQVLIINFHN